jgi:hypothetical protein
MSGKRREVMAAEMLACSDHRWAAASNAARIVGNHNMSRPVREAVVPSLDDGFGLGARSLVGGVADDAGLDVQSPRPNPHGAPHSAL